MVVGGDWGGLGGLEEGVIIVMMTLMVMVTKLSVPVNDNSDQLDCSHFLWGVIKRRQGKKQQKKHSRHHSRLVPGREQ